jgi:hypothetical protein
MVSLMYSQTQWRDIAMRDPVRNLPPSIREHWRDLPPDVVLVYPGQTLHAAVEEFRDRTGWGDGVFLRLVDWNGQPRDKRNKPSWAA